MATTIAPHDPPALSNEEVLRYSRHLIMPEVGMEGQQKLKAARVLCIGTGGLGSPLALYLSAAGVGTLGWSISTLSISPTLQRQVIHFTSDVGRPKLESAGRRLQPLILTSTWKTFETRLNQSKTRWRSFPTLTSS